VPGGRRRWGRVTAAVGYTRETVNHAEPFVSGNVHVVGVESFWSLFKRAIIGVCQRVSAKYIQAYLNVFVFRFDNRHNRSIYKSSSRELLEERRGG
jgi:hypothetical protein